MRVGGRMVGGHCRKCRERTERNRKHGQVKEGWYFKKTREREVEIAVMKNEGRGGGKQKNGERTN